MSSSLILSFHLSLSVLFSPLLFYFFSNKPFFNLLFLLLHILFSDSFVSLFCAAKLSLLKDRERRNKKQEFLFFFSFFHFFKQMEKRYYYCYLYVLIYYILFLLVLFFGGLFSFPSLFLLAMKFWGSETDLSFVSPCFLISFMRFLGHRLVSLRWDFSFFTVLSFFLSSLDF